MSKVKCSLCKTYVNKDSAIYNGFSYFCSNEHLLEKRIKLNKGKQNNTTKVASTRNDKVFDRQRILKRDRYRCRLCGQRNNLAVHHIIYKSSYANKKYQDEPSNLITLCNEPCHLTIVHGNKKKYQPLCLQIIWLTYINNNRYITINKLLEKENNGI